MNIREKWENWKENLVSRSTRMMSWACKKFFSCLLFCIINLNFILSMLLRRLTGIYYRRWLHGCHFSIFFHQWSLKVNLSRKLVSCENGKLAKFCVLKSSADRKKMSTKNGGKLNDTCFTKQWLLGLCWFFFILFFCFIGQKLKNVFSKLFFQSVENADFKAKWKGSSDGFFIDLWREKEFFWETLLKKFSLFSIFKNKKKNYYCLKKRKICYKQTILDFKIIFFFLRKTTF